MKSNYILDVKLFDQFTIKKIRYFENNIFINIKKGPQNKSADQ